MAEKYEIKEYTIKEEPFYLPQSNEIDFFEMCFNNKIPIALIGPTGCGKTRLVEHMAWRLGKKLAAVEKKKQDEGKEDSTRPFVTISCHEDLSANDLIGRYILKGQEGVWQDGPLLTAVKHGGICYLDEVVEARKDTAVVLHSLSDYRRTISVEKLGEIYEAHPDFFLVISWNPNYQNISKNLKQSTRQRFETLKLGYPSSELETKIVAKESGVEEKMAKCIVEIGGKIRNLKGKGLDEGASTRLLVYAGQLIKAGAEPKAVLENIVNSISDDIHDDTYSSIKKGINEVIENYLPRKK